VLELIAEKLAWSVLRRGGCSNVTFLSDHIPQEDLILELVYFVFFTGSMNMLEDCIEDVDDDDFHDFSNRLSFLEEDVRKMKRKVKKL